MPTWSLTKSGIASDTIDSESSSVYITLASGGVVNSPGNCDTTAYAGTTVCISIAPATTMAPRRLPCDTFDLTFIFNPL